MEPLAKTLIFLDCMPESMPKIEYCSYPALSLIAAHNVRLDFATACDCVGQHLRITIFQPCRVVYQETKKGLIRDQTILNNFC